MNNSVEQNIGKIVTFFVVVSYFEIFKFMAFPNTVRILFQIAAIAMMIVLIGLKIIYSPGTRIKKNFAAPITLMMLGALPSYFIAEAYHGQPFIISIYANRIIWFYFLYFFVHHYRVPVRFIVRLIIFIGLFAVALYYIQFFMFPKMIMDVNFQETRGTIRLFIAGMIFTQVAYFYFLSRYLSHNRIVYLIFALLCFSIYILQGTRQLLFAFVFLSVIYLFLAKRIRSRVLIFFVFGVGSISLFFLFREIFIELTKVSESQVQTLGQGVRIKATRFFLTDFMPNTLGYLFGNGESALGSRYSMELGLYILKNGYYLSDIGLIGDYVKYGIVFILAGIYMIIKALRFKVSDNLLFFKFYILTQCFTSLTGYGFLAGVDITLLLILYIFDVDRAEIISKKTSIEHMDEFQVEAQRN